MDYQEVIELLKSANRSNDMVGILPKSNISKVIVSAMEELKQYRELCKPEEIEHFKTLARIIRRHGTIGKALDTCAEYETIGTPEECREAVEKQVSMKVTNIHIDEYYCPSCGAENNCDGGVVGDKYCPVCGQRLE